MGRHGLPSARPFSVLLRGLVGSYAVDARWVRK